MKKKIFIFLLVFILSFPLSAYMTSGTGTKTCAQWVKNKAEIISNNNAHNIIRAATVQWIKGYLSALNFFSEINNKKFKNFSKLNGKEILLNVEIYCKENASKLIEVDINPLIIRPKNKGVIAADALIHYLDEIN